MPKVPAQGGQKNYTEKPRKVYGEQYRVGQPLPVGALADIGDLFPASGGPYVSTSTGVYTLLDTDWVLTSQTTGVAIEAITDEEFTDRYGGGSGPAVDG